MANWIRGAALALCVMLLLPSGLAATAAADGLNDIIDGESAPPADTANPDGAPSFADLADPGSAPDEPAATPPASALGAPTFGSIDTTRSAADSLTNAGDAAQQAADITKNCKFKASEGKLGALGDSKLSTYWSNKKKATLRITLPANDTAGGLYVEWTKKPAAFQIVEYDAANAELQSRDQGAYTGLVSVYPLLPETKRIDLVFSKKVALSTLRVFSQGDLPTSVQNWSAPYEKCDLMVVAAHQDDEWLYFGGSIPYYGSVRGKAVQVVYMANCGRARYAEALNGLWAAGVRNAPDFVGLPDKLVKNLKDARKVWKNESVLELLVARIRRYKPEVIVSHDPKGEYGHGQHMMTAEALKQAVQLAADETKYRASADAYGAWQVQKLYLHLYPEKQIAMDWKTPAPELGDRTPSAVAKLAYAAHKSQHKHFTYEEGGKYDNAKFGLAFTAVGDDERKDDFFEHLVEGAAKLNPPAAAIGEPDAALPPDDGEPAQPDEDFFDDGDLDEGDLAGFEDAPADIDGEIGAGDGVDGEAEVPVAPPPAEPGAPANTAGLLAAVIGVPVLLGGSAAAAVAGRKSLKKRRRAARKADDGQIGA